MIILALVLALICIALAFGLGRATAHLDLVKEIRELFE